MSIDEDEKQYDYMFRYIIVGDVGVGKSCIFLQFTSNQFRASYELTIGVDFGVKSIDLDQKTIKIQVWDTAGQEAFQSIARGYYRGAVGALLVYDITSKETFTHASKWLEEVQNNSTKNITIILIGNKTDKEEERQVTFEEGQKFANDNNLMFFESSAKTAYNIQEIFFQSAQRILLNVEDLVKEEDSLTIGPNQTEKKEKGCWC